MHIDLLSNGGLQMKNNYCVDHSTASARAEVYTKLTEIMRNSSIMNLLDISGLFVVNLATL